MYSAFIIHFATDVLAQGQQQKPKKYIHGSGAAWWMGCCCALRRGARAARARANWVRLVIKLQRIRKLQRFFHNTGVRLQDFPRRLLDRLTRQFKRD